jgi:NAD(P)-dependent dehydrogenase (short-subunit alcohol dehydrogenase family)
MLLLRFAFSLILSHLSLPRYFCEAVLDIVINNAGYGHFGMVEELSKDDIRTQVETNFFGALWVTQAALPIMRKQRSGRIIQVTSEGGIRAFPGIGAYHASKWALEGLSQSLSQEVEHFGIHITMVEPDPYSTDWLAGLGTAKKIPTTKWCAPASNMDGNSARPARPAMLS